jgi:hypothetical protein
VIDASTVLIAPMPQQVGVEKHTAQPDSGDAVNVRMPSQDFLEESFTSPLGAEHTMLTAQPALRVNSKGACCL